MANPLDFMSEDAYNEAVYEEAMGYQGDARRCPRHPNVKTSSVDGMHDGVCGACEAQMDGDCPHLHIVYARQISRPGLRPANPMPGGLYCQSCGAFMWIEKAQ